MRRAASRVPAAVRLFLVAVAAILAGATVLHYAVQWALPPGQTTVVIYRQAPDAPLPAAPPPGPAT